MNAITQTEPVSAGTIETILTQGDLAALTPAQRVEYMTRTCQSLGLNPLTQPFRFLKLNGQIQMYATRACTDQLRATRKISLAVVDKSIDEDLFCVTVRATTPDGRNDEDMGAVMLGQLRGEARANAIMKGITKAKRRVTLSICGLGYLDEIEVETLPRAQTFDAEADIHPMSEDAPHESRSFRDQALAGDFDRPKSPHAVQPQPIEDTWIGSAERQLLAEQNAWKWTRLLMKLMGDAPDIASLDALDSLPIVVETQRKAPADPLKEIEAARMDARKRLLPITEKYEAHDQGDAVGEVSGENSQEETESIYQAKLDAEWAQKQVNELSSVRDLDSPVDAADRLDEWTRNTQGKMVELKGRDSPHFIRVRSVYTRTRASIEKRLSSANAE